MNTIMTLIYVSFGFGLTSTMALVIFAILVGQPGFANMKAKLKKAPLILLVRKDRQVRLITGDYLGGTLDTKHYGTYLVEPNAMFPFYGSQVGLAYEKVGAVIPEKISHAVAELKESGIKDISEAEDLKNELVDELADSETPEDRKIEVRGMLQNITLVADFFKYALNPSQITTKISNAIKIHEGKTDKNVVMYLGGIAIAFFIIAIGAYILLGKNCPACTDCVGMVDRVCGAARTAATSAAERSII